MQHVIASLWSSAKPKCPEVIVCKLNQNKTHPPQSYVNQWTFLSKSLFGPCHSVNQSDGPQSSKGYQQDPLLLIFMRVP